MTDKLIVAVIVDEAIDTTFEVESAQDIKPLLEHLNWLNNGNFDWSAEVFDTPEEYMNREDELSNV